MCDPADDHETRVVVDGVDDPVIANTDPVVVAPGELRDSPRPGVGPEAVDRSRDAVTERTL
jgi:hypothetical protein